MGPADRLRGTAIRLQLGRTPEAFAVAANLEDSTFKTDDAPGSHNKACSRSPPGDAHATKNLERGST